MANHNFFIIWILIELNWNVPCVVLSLKVVRRLENKMRHCLPFLELHVCLTPL